MKNIFYVISIICALSTGAFGQDLNDQVINHDIAQHIEYLKEQNEFSSEDFNACQIAWTVKEIEKTDNYSLFRPYEVTFQYENKEVIKLINHQDGEADSVKGLGLNCLEFNNYVYLFFDTLDYTTRLKFGLEELSYVIYSSDNGESWSKLLSLHSFSIKANFILPHSKFRKYLKVFGNKNTHALSIYNLRDETTYLFDPEFNILKTVPVYNRLSDFDYPADFYYYRNILYLARGSCELVRGNIQCPSRTYMETSRDLGRTWKKQTLPFIKKSYFLILDNTLHHFTFKPCPDGWLNPIPAFNRSLVCGNLQVRKLNILGKWEKPKTLLRTVDTLIGIYPDIKPILVWKDFRYHKTRPCGFIPLIGCVDSTPFHGPEVIYAGKLDTTNWTIDESIIKYKK